MIRRCSSGVWRDEATFAPSIFWRGVRAPASLLDADLLDQPRPDTERATKSQNVQRARMWSMRLIEPDRSRAFSMPAWGTSSPAWAVENWPGIRADGHRGLRADAAGGAAVVPAVRW